MVQSVLALAHLAHKLCFVEPIARSKLRPVGTSLARSDASRRFARIASAFGVTPRAALLLDGTTETVGMSYPSLRRYVRDADVLINVSGMLKEPALVEPVG